MTESLEKLPKEILGAIRLAGDTASAGNMNAYLVGGFVRDLILGVKNFDLDIVVEGEGIKFADDFGRRLNAKVIRHKRFGTATVVIGHHLKIDIATARKEFYPQPASLPSVTRSTLKDDLARRDFTINAMAISITGDNYGQLIDFFDGRRDLRNRKISVLHSLSFIDDPTRILRAIRFEKRYGFQISPETLKLLREAVKLDMLGKVQPQRIRDELILLLKEKTPELEIRRMRELTGFKFIDQRLCFRAENQRLFLSIGSTLAWFNQVHAHRRTIDTWVIYFMGLLEPLSIDRVKSLCRNFMFRKGEEKRILTFKLISRSFVRELSRSSLKASRVYSLLEPLSYEVILLLKARFRNRNLQRHIDDFFLIYNDTRLHISGHDLRGLGLNPGPQYQRIFARVLDALLNGRVKTKEEELSLIRKLLHIG